MIAVDTSVWVAARRRREGAEARTLDGLLDADEVLVALPVRLELLSGVATRDRRTFRRAFSALPVAYPVEETWQLIDGWVGSAADRGHRFSVSDLLIGALAHERGALVWSLDDDFAAMERLGLVQRFLPARRGPSLPH
jgi:predicted nucleic acid-binding protein